jgi:hypothetical protein
MKTTIAFLYSSITGDFDGIRTKEILIQTSSNYFNAVSYKNVHRKKQKGTIILANSFSSDGHHDNKIIGLGKSLAKVGFNVIAVSFDDLNHLKINPKIVGEMVEIIEAIAKNGDDCPKGKISFLAPSFSAGLMLNACGHPKVAHLVNAVCAVGTYFNFEKSIHHAICSHDKCTRNFLLYNFIEHHPENLTGIFPLLEDALISDGCMDSNQKSEHPSPTRVDREIWEQINKNPIYRKNVLRESFANIPDREQWMENFNYEKNLQNLSATVVLIHGCNDSIIPETESEELHRTLLAHGKKSHLCITPTFNSEKKSSNNTLSHMSNYIDLYRAFSTFFKYASA